MITIWYNVASIVSRNYFYALRHCQEKLVLWLIPSWETGANCFHYGTSTSQLAQEEYVLRTFSWRISVDKIQHRVLILLQPHPVCRGTFFSFPMGLMYGTVRWSPTGVIVYMSLSDIYPAMIVAWKRPQLCVSSYLVLPEPTRSEEATFHYPPSCCCDGPQEHHGINMIKAVTTWWWSVA